MAIRPLFPLTKQFQARNGQNNVSGTLEVFYAYTDDRAPTYSDYNGTRNPDLVPIDNNGRAVVLCNDERVYRLVVRDRSGGILWTQEPTVCEGEGSGGSTSIVSEDGSIVVQRTGSVYDLSVNHTDDSRFLDWIRCTGGESVSGYLRPVKAAGTMAVGSLGLSLSPDVLYHVTATIRAVKGSVAPVYGEVSVTLALHDGETAKAVRTFSEIADCSMGLSQDYIVDADVHTPSNATQLVFSVTGDDASLSFLLLSVDAHRVYSGVPHIPDEVAQKTWVDANFQKKLVAGANITIDPVTNTISADALTQVQADWTQSNPADMSYIRNKPTLATVATSGSYDDLSDKPAIPAAQVNSDWSASTGVAQILNKPDLSVYATTQDMDTALATKQDTISDLASIRAGAALGDTAVQPGDLATVATSGSYNDLTDKPDIPGSQVQSDWTESDSADPAYIKHKPSLAAVATSGSYSDLTNKPTIPAAQVNSDWSASSGVSQILNKPNLATVATSGSYSDLTNKPDIPAAQVNSDWSAVSGVSQILNKPNLATVATSGSYDDLTDKPSIPVIPTMKSLVAGTNVTLTEGSTTVTVSAASQVQADWTESNTSDPAYIAHKPVLASVATSGSYSDLSNTPSLATVATTGAYSDLSGTPDLSLKEDVANKAQSIDGTSTTDYPSSAAVSDFVNSSIATATARFLGNFTLTDLGLTYPATDSQIGTALDAYTWPVGTTPTNNDYVYVEIQDPQTTGIDDRVERFKYDGTNWLYEYTLNNSSFTAAEKASIDSGITATKVSNYDAHIANSDIHVTSADKTAWNGKQDAIGDLNTIRSGAQAGATAVQPGDLATVATTGVYSDLSGTPTINNVPAVTSGDDGKVLTASYSGGVGSYSWATGGGGGGTVDQTYDPTSTNAQSGTAVAQAVSGKEDDFDAGEGLEFTTDGQGNRVLQVEGPVDIVAGPGIVIDNPDGNTLRISQAYPTDETVLWENSAGTRATSGSLSEPMSHFEYIEFYSINNDYQCLPSTRYHVNSTFLSNISGQLGVSMGGVCFNNTGTPLIKAAQIKATDSAWSIATTVDYVLGRTSKTTDMDRCWPSRIVGINRTTSAQ